MTSREQFEAEYSKLMGTPVSVLVTLRVDDDYRETEGERLSISWEIWKASRAAVEVVLPQPEQWDITEVLLDKVKVVSAIRAAGIRVKGDV